MRDCVNPTYVSLLHDAHDSAIAGHFGFEKTYQHLHSRFYWPSMAKDTKLYVQSCENCQRNKPDLERPAGLLQPLPIPPQRWHTVTMDFITQLPKTPRGFDSVVVFVDKLSKQTHYIPCQIGRASCRERVYSAGGGGSG